MTGRDRLYKMIQTMQSTPLQNPWWTIDEYNIPCHTDGEILNLEEFRPILDIASTYFKQVYDSFGSEAQVLVLFQNDYKQIKHLALPIIPNTTEYTIVVLPQYNTTYNTVLSEDYYQQVIKSKGITPLMRIHSHHILDAYQSVTDYNTLNSNTLEVVIGHVTSKQYDVCYWLDIAGTDNKKYTYKLTQEK